MEFKNIVWQEKYRPSKLEDVIGEHKTQLLNYIKDESSMPHLIFYSRTPGTGKSSSMKAIINELKCDYLIINSSDDRKIETIRDRVKDFVQTKSSNGKRRCVAMDEADGLTPVAMDALRNLIETYSRNAFFLFSVNNLNKIIEPIKSRCVTIEFTKPNKMDIYNYLEMICKNESLTYDKEALIKLIDLNYPSIRNCVNYLQNLKIQNKDCSIDNIKRVDDEFMTILTMIKNQEFTQIKTFILENGVDCINLNKWLFDKIFDDEFTMQQKLKVIRIVADNEYKFKLGADNQITFINSCIDLILVLKG